MIQRFVKDMRRYTAYAVYAAKVSLKSEVANSYLNWIWWVLEPILNMVVYTFVFKSVFGRSDVTYPVFIYSGVITWNYFSRNIIYSVKAMRSNKGKITKIYLPKYIIIISNMFLNMFKLLVGMAVMIPMLFLYKVPITFKMLWLIPIYAGLFLFTFGCGVLLMHLGVFIDDLGHAVTILLHVLMYVSGIFYDVENALSGKLAFMAKVNPIAFFIKSVRNAILGTGAVRWEYLLMWYAVSCVIILCGIKIVYKYENSYVKVI